VLREVKNAGFARRWSLTGRRYAFVEGERVGGMSWSARRMRALRERQAELPVPLFAREERVYWLFEDRVFWEDEGLGAADVRALARERERRRRRRLERAHAALAPEEAGAATAAGRARPRRRDPLVREVRLAVWRRDGGRCVACGADFELQFDHVIPVALGGADTVENLQVLCAPCNQRKGAAIA
jgi:hypothetical protein